MRILVVEDDDRIADFLVRALKSEGHTAVRTADGREGFELGKDADFELIILDLMLPGMHGLDVCQELRARRVRTPIVMLTAMDTLDDVVTGLRTGADDYIRKPFVIDELLARIEAVVRRGSPEPARDDMVRVADVELDRRAMRVTVAGKPIELTAKEHALLEFFMRHPGEVLPRSLIAASVWDMNFDSDTNVVDVAVRRLRRKVDNDFEPKLIQTVRGMGYVLDEPS